VPLIDVSILVFRQGRRVATRGHVHVSGAGPILMDGGTAEAAN